MNEVFNRIYQWSLSDPDRQLQRLREANDVGISEAEIDSLRAAIVKVIREQSAEFASQMKIRPDAQFLAKLLFSEMILRPIIDAEFLKAAQPNIVGRDPYVFEPEAFLKSVSHDLNLVFQESLKIARESDREEISGHVLMSAIDRIWEALDFYGYAVWG